MDKARTSDTTSERQTCAMKEEVILNVYFLTLDQLPETLQREALLKDSDSLPLQLRTENSQSSSLLLQQHQET